MKTRNVLLITSDKELSELIKISALTLTKLNAQIGIEEAYDFNSAVEKSKKEIIDLIVIDGDIENIDPLKLIPAMRKQPNAKNKKIILIYTNSIGKDEIFKAGCDSIMSKEEFKKVINNILTI